MASLAIKGANRAAPGFGSPSVRLRLGDKIYHFAREVDEVEGIAREVGAVVPNGAARHSLQRMEFRRR